MSKKVLNSCKLLLLLSGAAFAQTQSEPVAPPSVSMPSMPSVSMPSVGSGFYTPGRSDFYAGTNPNRNRNNSSQTSSSKDTASIGTTSSATASTTTASSNTKNQSQKNNASEKTSSLALNQLTADDISSMNSLGILGSLSGLMGRGNTNLQNQLLSSQNTVTASTVDSATLKQILAELSELKNKMSKEANDGKTADGEKVSLNDKSFGQNTFATPIKKEPKILRFSVNGYDLISTCKKIYFSELETDGTFLLTGDRKYMSESKVRSETFYFYFRANGTENGVTKYAVTPAVSQDYENEYSYLYQLTQKNNLTADRTGNLVTLRVNDGDWKMDLLISLDK